MVWDDTGVITRDEIAIRQKTVWVPGTVPYSQSTWYPGPYGSWRGDCSGYVSGVLGLDRSYSTIDLPDVCDQIDEADLQLGDLIGLMGPGTGGDAGHVMSFESRSATGLVIWEQAGGTIGQRRRTIKGVPAGNACYRYREVLSVDAERLINNMAAILSGVAAGLDSAPQTFPDGHVEPLDITGFYRCDHSGTGVLPEHFHNVAGVTGPAQKGEPA